MLDGLASKQKQLTPIVEPINPPAINHLFINYNHYPLVTLEFICVHLSSIQQTTSSFYAALQYGFSHNFTNVPQ